MDKNQDKFSKHYKQMHKENIRNHENMCSESIKLDPSLIAAISRNRCSYCHKVFFSSKFLLKHVARRHSDSLVKLHKKLLSHESDVNSSDIQQVVAVFREDFSLIKKELTELKHVVGKINDSASSGDPSCNKLKSASKEKTPDFDLKCNEFEILKSKVGYIENSLQDIYSKLEDLNTMIKTEVLLKRDANKNIAFNEEKILSDQKTQFIKLREDLCRQLENMLSKHSNDIDSNWKLRISELNKEVKRLDRLVETVSEQVDSPDYLQNIEKKLEHHIVNFLGNSRHRDKKARTPKSRRKFSASKAHNGHSVNLSKANSTHSKASDTLKQKELNKPSVTVNELSYMLAEKCAELNFAPNISKMSESDYLQKLRIIETEKELLKKQYPTFIDDYGNLCMQVDHMFQNQLKSRKNYKIRFSETLDSSSKVPHDSKTDIMNYNPEASPSFSSQKFDKTDIRYDSMIPKRRFSKIKQSNFSDENASGDYNRDVIRKCDSDHSRLIYVKKLHTSTPISEARKSEVRTPFSEDYSVIKPVPSSSRKVLDYAENDVCNEIDYVCKKHPSENGFLFEEPIAVNKNEFEDDFDANSIESLSSWEEENSSNETK